VVLVIVAVMVWVAGRAHSRAQVVLLGIVIGGALGNLVDRAFRAEDGWLSGAVVDFVDVQWWPVFNVADAAVVCGGIALVVLAWFEPGGDPDPADDASPGGTGDDALEPPSDPPSEAQRT
jgi:signal peptidase II